MSLRPPKSHLRPVSRHPAGRLLPPADDVEARSRIPRAIAEGMIFALYNLVDDAEAADWTALAEASLECIVRLRGVLGVPEE